MSNNVNSVVNQVNNLQSFVEYLKEEFKKDPQLFLDFVHNYRKKHWPIDKEFSELATSVQEAIDNDKSIEEYIERMGPAIQKYAKETYIRVVDVTLREWDQAPGGWMNKFQKAAMAMYLKAAGLDVIELWFAANPADYDNIKYILQHIGNGAGHDDPYLSTLCRSNRGDIERAKELFRVYKKPRIHIFYATSESHLKSKVAKSSELNQSQSLETVKKSFLDSIDCALELADVQPNMELEISFEDAANTYKETLKKLAIDMIKKWREKNIHVIINLPSTLWDKVAWEVWDMFQYVNKWLEEHFWDYINWSLSTHNHNDNATAISSSWAAVEWWATNVETTVLWLWEWAGNTPTHIFVNQLINEWYKYGTKFLERFHNTRASQKLVWHVSRFIEDLMNIDLNKIIPYIWEYVYLNSSWVHNANADVYRSIANVAKYGWKMPDEFFSSRWWTKQVGEILSRYSVVFFDETPNFRSNFMVRIQREAEIVKFLYPSRIFAIYQEMKQSFSITSIIREEKMLKISLQVQWETIDLKWNMWENGVVDGVVNALNNYLWEGVVDCWAPELRAVVPLRKTVQKFMSGLDGETIQSIQAISSKVDQIVTESERYHMIEGFVWIIDTYHGFLRTLKYCNEQLGTQSNKLTDEQRTALVAEKTDIESILSYRFNGSYEEFNLDNALIAFSDLRKGINEVISGDKEMKDIDEKLWKCKDIINDPDIQNHFTSSLRQLTSYNQWQVKFSEMASQTWIAQTTVRVWWNDIKSIAYGRDLWDDTIRSIIYAALPEIIKKQKIDHK